jgi:hypothetical protein
LQETTQEKLTTPSRDYFTWYRSFDLSDMTTMPDLWSSSATLRINLINQGPVVEAGVTRQRSRLE